MKILHRVLRRHRSHQITEHTSPKEMVHTEGLWRRAEQEALDGNAIAARKIGEVYTMQLQPNDTRSLHSAIHWLERAHAAGDGYAPILLAHLHTQYTTPIIGVLPGELFTPTPHLVPALLSDAYTRRHPHSYGAYARFLGPDDARYWPLIEEGATHHQDDWCLGQIIERATQAKNISEITGWKERIPLSTMGQYSALAMGIAMATYPDLGSPFPHMEHASQQGSGMASFFLGRHLIQHNQDIHRGETLLRAARSQGIQDATVFLADWKTIHPDHGTQGEAMALYWEAADAGHHPARAVLGIRALADPGQHINLTPDQARQWIHDAATQGVDIARRWQAAHTPKRYQAIGAYRPYRQGAPA